MQIKVGNLFDSKDDYTLVTANSFVKRDGSLVMGRGAARQLATLHPSFPRIAGQYILEGSYPLHHGLPVYGVILIGRYGLFQVKYHWTDDADLDLIKFSVDELGVLLNSGEIKTVSMNFPGIGNGRLTEEMVLPIISVLPDTVTVYKYATKNVSNSKAGQLPVRSEMSGRRCFSG